MILAEAALAALLLTRETAPVQPPPVMIERSAPLVFDKAEIASFIRRDLEKLAGPGAVDISIVADTLFSIRIKVPGLNSRICTPLYNRELAYYRLFPDLNFDFYLWLKP